MKNCNILLDEKVEILINNNQILILRKMKKKKTKSVSIVNILYIYTI